MLLIGLAFLIFGGLIYFFGLAVEVSAFVVGTAYFLLGLVLGERFNGR